MKLLETRSVAIGENTFYIRPLPAFRAANLSAELAALLIPLLSGFAPLFADVDMEKGEGKSLLDMDMEDAAPAIARAFSSLSGEKLEEILKHLLISGKNVSMEMPDGKAQLLTMDIANEAFCTDVQDMFLLAFEVIRTNYNGFFKKLGGRFGQAMEMLKKKAAPGKNDTESLT
jgi:hypothetical protein